MRAAQSLALLVSTVTALSHGNVQSILTNDDHANYEIPSIHDSAVQARRIAQLAGHGELVTSFPLDEQQESGDFDTQATPTGLGGSPIALIEYIADCEPGSGNPTLLAIDIATPYRNYRAGSNISLALRWWPPEKSYYMSKWTSWFGTRGIEIPTPRTPVALPRFSLHGRLEPIDTRGFEGLKIAQCFIRKHPDSIYWQPSGGAHASHYARFVVEEVYWLGGFGDRARIGWLPIDEWQKVTQAEIDQCRLPGEE